MRLPRDWSGEELAQRLRRLGYEPVRQTGSHLRLACKLDDGTHNITIPLHRSIRVGTLNSILNDVAARRDLSRDELLRELLS